MSPDRYEVDQVRLCEALRRNRLLWEALQRMRSLGLPDWYIGAGCISQTVWNLAHGRAPCDGIRDYDIVYFDVDRTPAAEAAVAARVGALLSDLDIAIDVKNQARVHHWYRDRFGYDCPPFSSTAHAISMWPTTATAIGVRTGADRELSIYAPFGTRDLFGLVVRPNEALASQEVYERKASRWKRRWPRLRVMSWNGATR